MIRAVIFDVDGTLVDHEAAARHALSSLQRALPGLAELDGSEFWEAWREAEHHHFSEYLSGKCSFFEQRRRRLRSVFSDICQDLGNDALDELFRAYLNVYEASWRCFDDVEPALQSLKSRTNPLKLAVLTNGDHDQQITKLHRVGIGDYFDVVMTSGELGFAKPDPRSFHAVCSELGALPSEVMHVGDNLDIDALGAVHAGLIGVWLNRNGLSRASQEAIEIRSLDDVYFCVERTSSAGTTEISASADACLPQSALVARPRTREAHRE